MNTTMTGPAITDQIVASEALNILKSSLKNTAIALTETATNEVRQTLVRHFNESVHGHEILTDLMIQRKWYQAYDIGSQVQVDIQNAQSTLQPRQ
ncbi:MAG: spore coat protein [Firmicutes bacterium]|nr:spore coat protein [Bacillota bacterium]